VTRARKKGGPRGASRTATTVLATSLEAAARSLGARVDPILELFDYLKDVLFWIKDRKGTFRWVNTPLMLDLAKTRREDVIGKTDFDLFESYLANQYQMDDAQVLKGRPIVSRVELIVFNHAPRWIVTSKLPLRAPNGRIVGTAGVATRSAQQGSTLWTESRLAPAMAFISEHYHEPVSIRAMAEKCALSPGAFHRQFRDTYLVTPHTYVRQLRVRMSCHALVFSRRPIAAVAAECGFSDQSHFTKEFRRIMGETPRSYRQRHRH
jgi:AraC-like DNA-binding protein